MKAKYTILTKEERDVLVLAAPNLSGQHLNNTEIGQRLCISAGRVQTLIHQACIKLGAHNRYEALYIAIRQGVVRLDELYTLDELAELLSAFCPDMLRRITHLVHEELENGHFTENGEQFIRTDSIQDTILTKREQDVIALVGRGLTNREIADTLYMSINAVRTYIYRACTKLGTHRRAGAVALAMKRGEMSIGEMYSSNELLRLLAPLGSESLEKIAQLLSQKLEQEPVPSGG